MIKEECENSVNYNIVRFVWQYPINETNVTNSYIVECIWCIKEMKTNNKRNRKNDIRNFFVHSNKNKNRNSIETESDLEEQT